MNDDVLYEGANGLAMNGKIVSSVVATRGG